VLDDVDRVNGTIGLEFVKMCHGVSAVVSVNKNAVRKGTYRTQIAYESCPGPNLGSVPIQGNPPRA
jgi:hypothetical protein